ncbi:unnamed protein product [Prorocentrum cordatum]|uniref:Feruloyl esterase n=1 Tax=Prorocentrum cordatum TaxID=2364126 RepID=A0ABN9YCF9_9DINO|nr:unnamed protein product [Polarella glacialis]
MGRRGGGLAPGRRAGATRRAVVQTVLLDHRFDHNGQRRYHALVPDGYPRSAPYPAIVMFHGNGGDASSFTCETNMTQRAREAGYVLVYVDGAPAANSTLRSRARSWNAGTCCDEALLRGIDDVAYTAEVLRTLPESLAVDAARIFLAGVSNGASRGRGRRGGRFRAPLASAIHRMVAPWGPATARVVLRAGCELPSLVAGLAVVDGSLETRDGRSCGAACQPRTPATPATWRARGGRTPRGAARWSGTASCPRRRPAAAPDGTRPVAAERTGALDSPIRPP